MQKPFVKDPEDWDDPPAPVALRVLRELLIAAAALAPGTLCIVELACLDRVTHPPRPAITWAPPYPPLPGPGEYRNEPERKIVEQIREYEQDARSLRLMLDVSDALSDEERPMVWEHRRRQQP